MGRASTCDTGGKIVAIIVVLAWRHIAVILFLVGLKEF
jgi:hypothetical protein